MWPSGGRKKLLAQAAEEPIPRTTMYNWQWVDEHHNREQGPDKRPQFRITELAESKPETVEGGEQESGDLGVFAVVNVREDIEL